MDSMNQPSSVKLSTEKYFGLSLRKGLDWETQLDILTNNICKAFRTLGKTWGLRTKVMHRICSMVVRPLFNYATTVWSMDIFNSRNISGHTKALGLTEPLTGMSNRNISVA
jgi:hypothetical protein